MEGDSTTPENRGIILRASQHIFSALEKSAGVEYTVKASYLQLYNEMLDDLLVDDAFSKELKLFDDPRRGVVCQNLEQVPVTNVEAVSTLLERVSELG